MNDVWSNMKDKFSVILDSDTTRQEKAKQITTLICHIKNYSWSGLYDVSLKDISIISCNGEWPEFPVFPRNKGLNGRAVATKEVVMVNDIQKDPDYLTTFGKTQSELIIPILSHTNEVVGTIDVESHFKNAFHDSDVEFLKECSAYIIPLWRR